MEELTRWAEEHYMPACDYVTASSEDIARAYAQCLGIPEPVTVLNTFPLSDRARPVDAAELMRERDARAISLYWFSQTIGPGRGLEAAIDALPLLDPRCVLTLRGAWAPGFEAQLRARALALGVGDRLRHLPPCPPPELVRRAQCHDVGLAIESPRTINHDLCLSNKIFTYLMAGVPAVATDTTGQRRLCRAFPAATRLIPPDDPIALARAIGALYAAPEARAAAWEAGSAKCWESERAGFLSCVAGVVDRTEHGMRRVLIVCPQFAPVSAADMHRVRQSLPYLGACGWEAVVLAIEPRRCESPVDPLLEQTIPSDTRVVRTGALA